MGDKLKKLSELKTVFAKWPEMADLVEKVKLEVDDINQRNVQGGGADEIGKQYHEKIDKPTEGLTLLVTQIREKLLKIGEDGQNAATLFDDANEHATNVVR
ncbi:hypothetical protein [Kitasatospora sp. NPDC056181]|uniref:hypothetical protein n=1 Tax=Kitasatospora sp. NPDC056181 TaxID=3345737 RepID=UPI0035D79AF8